MLQKEMRAPDEMPMGLMMRMAQNTRAMDSFFSMPHTHQQEMLDYIRTSPTGDEAKSRIEHSIEALVDHSQFEQYTHHDR